MALYLIQHGKALSKEEDSERGLSPEGIAETKRIAEVASNYSIHVLKIIQSGKKRALQTAEIMAEHLKPEFGITESAGMAPNDDVVDFAANMGADEDVMYVGHLPFMARLTSFLITGYEDRPVMKYQNSGIVCLEKDPETNAWIIRWTLMPHIY